MSSFTITSSSPSLSSANVCASNISRSSLEATPRRSIVAATRAKLARNLITFVSYSVVAEAQRLAEASGVDLRKLAKVVRHSDAVIGGPGSIMVRDTTSPLRHDDVLYAPLDHARLLGIKDLSLARELADQFDLELPMTALGLALIGPSLGFPTDQETP